MAGRRLRTPLAGVLLLVAVMVAVAGGAWSVGVSDPDAALAGPRVPWWLLALMFGVAEVVVIRLHFRREAQNLSLSELPLVIALFLATPVDLLVGVTVGAGFVYVVVRRQSPLKATFNITLRAFGAVVTVGVFQAGLAIVTEPGGPGDVALGPAAWIVAIVAIVMTSIADGLLVLSAIAIHHRGVGPGEIVREVLRAPLTGPLVGCVGLIAVTAVQADARAGVLLLILGGGLLAAYRAHASLTDRHHSLTGLYDFGRAVTEAHHVTAVVTSVLQGARDLLKVESAELVLLATRTGEPDLRYRLDSSAGLRTDVLGEHDPARWASVLAGAGAVLLPRRRSTDLLRALSYREAVIVGLPEESRIVGTLLVADRVSEVGTFTPDDVQLLETVANQASLALRNGRLVDLLRYDAFHDALTGLANRALFRQAVDAELARMADGTSRGCAVMLLDLDGFKQINDSLGHQAGDQLLVHVARQVNAATAGEAGMAARLGGDEFAVLLCDISGEEAARNSAERVMRLMCRRMVLDGVEVEVRGSLGIALTAQGSRDASVLLKQADEAMYRAKVNGGGIRVHDPGGGPPRHTQLEFLAELRRGLINGDVTVFVQPQAEAAGRRVFAAEALLRWHHPVLGLLTPEEFLPLADRNGLTHTILALVLDVSVEAAASWSAQDLGVAISVNVSPRSLGDPRTLSVVRAALLRHGLAPAQLTLEITEDGVMSDPDAAIDLLRTLRALGVRVSIDDFGTGHSSLSYLSRLPVHEVKIDGSFVASLASDADDLVIVRSIIDLGRNLDLQVVAEGVEDATTWAQLAAMGADVIQGYELARPMPLDGFPAWLAGYRATPPTVPVQGGGRLRQIR